MARHRTTSNAFDALIFGIAEREASISDANEAGHMVHFVTLTDPQGWPDGERAALAALPLERDRVRPTRAPFVVVTTLSRSIVVQDYGDEAMARRVYDATCATIGAEGYGIGYRAEAHRNGGIAR